VRGEGRSGCGALLEEKKSGCTREESRVRDLDLGRNGRQCVLRGEMPNARGGRGWKGQERRAARPGREIAMCGSTCKGRKARVLHGTHCHCLLHARGTETRTCNQCHAAFSVCMPDACLPFKALAHSLLGHLPSRMELFQDAEHTTEPKLGHFLSNFLNEHDKYCTASMGMYA
jgi:hypothetical protein